MKSYRTREKYELVYPKSEGKCYLCGQSIEEDFRKIILWFDLMRSKKKGEKMPFKRKSIPLNFDHIIPKSLDKRKESPLRTLDNLALVHKTCNNKKGNKILLLPNLTP